MPRSAGRSPTLDVVITTRPGRGARLRDALYSVAAQTHPGVRAVVVLVGGDDVEVAATHRLARRLNGLVETHVVPVDAVRGDPDATLRAGLEAARAELVCMLDDGDVLYPQFAAVLAAELAARPTLRAVHGVCVHAHGREEEHGFVVDSKAAAPPGRVHPSAVLHRRATLRLAGGEGEGEVGAVDEPVCEHRVCAVSREVELQGSPLQRLMRRIRGRQA